MSPKSKRYACTFEGCKSSFPRPSKLAIHMQLHEGKKPFPCSFVGCDKEYTTNAHLKRHHAIQHELNTSIVICTVADCNKEFSNQSNMQRHIKRAHNPDRVYNYSCKECEQSFPKKKLLHQHTYLHTGEFTYKCSTCNQGFHLLNEYNRHISLHSFYNCDECKEKFTAFNALRKHKLKHRVFYKCHVCNYKTPKICMLQEHKATHINFDKRTKFHCNYTTCSRSYFHLRNLNQHINVFHKGIKEERVKCTFDGCTRLLASKVCLRNHIRFVHNQLSRKVRAINRRRLIRKDAGVPRKNPIISLIASKLEDNANSLNEVAKVLIKT